MSIGLSTALSGISAANERLRASAQNTVSNGAADFRRQQLQAQQSDQSSTQLRQVPATGQSAEADLATQKSATYAFVANLRVLQTQLRASGTMLDIHA
ncbi:flagellar basal body rod protein [Paucibacter sp. DJ1R-11]|uniref:flagellar basal body rod protein n=1 Tax=Paucibacter sp. DJ1R-11 TaxID=2893556 RepID=UPI0021E37F37|nr:flagellar basal body rod protein [Paucibacter sp. DJ1R-11]MCV2364016.1 flagellar basal body rod protein [Paucibacter sp. DJ1R-11]